MMSSRVASPPGWLTISVLPRRGLQRSGAVAARRAPSPPRSPRRAWGRELAQQASSVSDEDELAAARKAAWRKRLGPWSRGDRAASRQKDLAALARAGFSIAVARAVIDGAADEDTDSGTLTS